MVARALQSSGVIFYTRPCASSSTAEQRTLNPQVSGSNPEGRTIKEQVTAGKSKQEAPRLMLSPTPIRLTDTPNSWPGQVEELNERFKWRIDRTGEQNQP